MERTLTNEHLEQFKNEVYSYLQTILVPSLLGLEPRSTKLHRRKEYYSQARGDPIVTDISLELSLVDAADPFLIWIWECKDYSGQVPVNDIEEFDSKLRQIGEHNTKGPVVSRNGFQRGAIQVAIAKGIGLGVLSSLDEDDKAGYLTIAPVDVLSPSQQREEDLSRLIGRVSRPSCGINLNGDYYSEYSNYRAYLARQLFELIPHSASPHCICCESAASISMFVYIPSK